MKERQSLADVSKMHKQTLYVSTSMLREIGELLEKTTESNVSNTGKTRVEWWRKRKEEPRRVRHKVSYQMVTKRRQKAAARPKSERYASGVALLFAQKHLEKMLKRVAKKAKRDAETSANKVPYPSGSYRDRYVSIFVAKRLNKAKARIKL